MRWFQALTKRFEQLIRELLFADDTTLVAHTELVLEKLFKY